MHILSVSICHKYCLSFDSSVNEKVVDTVLIKGLATVFMFLLIDLSVFFILKTATAIEHSEVISIVKIVEKLLLSFQCQEDLKTKVNILCTFNILCQGVPVGDNPVTD